MAMRERVAAETVYVKAKEIHVGASVEGILVGAASEQVEYQGREFTAYKVTLRSADKIQIVSCDGRLNAWAQDVMVGMAPKGLLVRIERQEDSYGDGNKLFRNYRITEDPEVTSLDGGSSSIPDDFAAANAELQEQEEESEAF